MLLIHCLYIILKIKKTRGTYMTKIVNLLQPI